MKNPDIPTIRLNADHPTVARLIELQGEQPDAAFANRWLSVSATTWFRVKDGTYKAQDHSKVLEKLTGGLAAIEDNLASRAKSPAGRVLPLTGQRAGLAAVRRAFAETRDRLVVYLAPTGGGKTTFARALEETYPGRITCVEATETWRTSYLAAIEAIATTAGVRDLPASARLAEAALLAALRTKPRILVIDEGHYFGSATINLLKAILNQTSCTIVLLAIPALWTRMKRAAWDEAEQLRTRTCALIELLMLPQDDVEALLADRLGAPWQSLNGHRKDAVRIVADACNQFGLLDTAERICKEVVDEVGENPLTLDIFKAAIRNVAAIRK